MEENLQFSALIKGAPLIRFTKAEYLDSFRKHGKIYMNSMKYYRDQAEGNSDSFIGDAYEGKLIVNKFNFSIPGNSHIEHFDKCIYSTPNENDYVFCMFTLTDSAKPFVFNEQQKQEFKNTYDNAIIILDCQAFIQRIIKGAKREGYTLLFDKVKYYDEDSNSLSLWTSLLGGMENIAFFKRNKYNYQQECRFVSPYISGKDHIEFNIGDITDITAVLSCEIALRGVITPGVD